MATAASRKPAAAPHVPQSVPEAPAPAPANVKPLKFGDFTFEMRFGVSVPEAALAVKRGVQAPQTPYAMWFTAWEETGPKENAALFLPYTYWEARRTQDTPPGPIPSGTIRSKLRNPFNAWRAEKPERANFGMQLEEVTSPEPGMQIYLEVVNSTPAKPRKAK